MTKPYPYQRKGILRMSELGGRVLLADEMGLGKTLQALLWVKRNQKTAAPAIVICPASLKYNWEHEAILHTNARVDVLEGRTPVEHGIIKPAHFTIINYDILGPWTPYLLAIGAKTLIVDECQYIKNRSTLRYKLVKALAKGIDNCLALSGTPLTNKPAELWPVLNLLRPKLYPSFMPYAKRHCSPELRRWGWVFNGAERLDELHAELKSQLMIRRLKKNVLKDLPPKTRTVIPMPLANRKEYDSASADFISWLRRHKPAKVKKAQRAEQLVRLGYLKRLAAMNKLPSVLEWAGNFLQETDRKLILFAYHKEIIATLHQKFKGESVLVTGGMLAKKRHLAVQAFQHSKNARIFIGQINAAGVGINLTAGSDLAFAELVWTPGEHIQVEDRVFRIGQDKPSTCYYLVARKTIEERLCKVIQEKQSVLNNVLDGGTGEQINILDQLMKEMKDGTTT